MLRLYVCNSDTARGSPVKSGTLTFGSATPGGTWPLAAGTYNPWYMHNDGYTPVSADTYGPQFVWTFGMDACNLLCRVGATLSEDEAKRKVGSGGGIVRGFGAGSLQGGHHPWHYIGMGSRSVVLRPERRLVTSHLRHQRPAAGARRKTRRCYTQWWSNDTREESTK